MEPSTDPDAIDGGPNVVLVVMDTARYGAIPPCEGSEIERIGADGTTFSNCAASAPWSLPSHASIFTGQYPSAHGAHAESRELGEGVPTLAERFRERGYETVGVSNNTWISEEFGFARGFDTFYKTWQYVQTETDLGRVARTKEGTDKLRAAASTLARGNPVTNVANAIYGRLFRRQYDDGARQTNAWIADWLDARDGADPFFLFVNYLEPHLEYTPPREIAEPFLPEGISYEEAMEIPQNAWAYIAGSLELTERELEALGALYRAELAYLDGRIGELRDALEERGEWEETIVVVTGDHGENIGDHGLMDHQYCLYETLLHVPLVIHGGPFTGGGTDDRLVQLTDLAPTLLDACGIDGPDARDGVQGTSFHPDADAPAREYAFAEYMGPQPPIDALETRLGELPEEIYDYDRSLRAIRTDEYKLIRGSDDTRELYRLAEDPTERRDLARDRPEIVADLETALEEWLASFDRAETDGEVSMTEATRKRLEEYGYLQ